MNQSDKNFILSPEVRVVEASAGSGKTYALAARYVVLALGMANDGIEQPMRSILALTFTNKAAIEMKSRILDFIKRIALDYDDTALDEAILKPLALPRSRAVELAGRLMAGIIRHYNYFQVETIDKFINTLLISCGSHSGLTSAFSIRTDSAAYIARALDDLLDTASVDEMVRTSFLDFIFNYLHVESRMEWMPKDIVFQAMRGLFSIENTFALPFTDIDVLPKDIIFQKKKVLSALERLRADMPAGTNRTFIKSLDKFLDGSRRSFRFNELSSFFSRIEIPVRKGSLVTSEQADVWNEIYTGFVQAARMEVEHLYDPYIRIYRLMRARLSEVCTRKDILFLEELNARVSVLFDDGLSVPDIFYRLAVRYRHYLIDEFQDTSVLQWENLRLLPEDALSSGGTLFYVGDRKQAIYGFRGGDARLFDDLKKCYQVYNVREMSLDVNWRSLPAIVKFNNMVFSSCSLKRFAAHIGSDVDGDKKGAGVSFSSEDIQQMEAVFSSSFQASSRLDGEGVVRVERVECADHLEETLDLVRLKVIALLFSLKNRGYDWKDIALLLRSNDEVEESARWLLEAGIPVLSERMSDIRENVFVIEVISFLCFLDVPGDNMAFANFISGDIFIKATGMCKVELEDFILGWRIGRNAAEKKESLYEVFRRTYALIWNDFIEAFFLYAGVYPLYELIVSFYRRMKALENGSEGQAYLMRLLELVREKEKDYPSLSGFLEHYEALEGEALYVKGPGGDAVELLTVHKSKGLEFPVVIIPLLTIKPKVSGTGKSRKHSYIPVVDSGGVSLLHVTQDYRKYSERADELYTREYIRSVMAELNMTYVALTRAEDELYVFIPSRAGRSVNVVLSLIPEDFCSLGNPGIACKRSRKGFNIAKNLVSSELRNWMEYLQDEFSSDVPEVSRYEYQQGLLRHAVLARIGRLDPGVNIHEVVLSALRPAGDVNGMDILYEIEKFLNHIDVRPFFFTSAEVLCERAFLLPSGEERRPDRVLVFDDQVWVIDFKLSMLMSTGRDQMRGYLRILSEVYSSRQVRGFLVAMTEVVVEEVFL